MPSTIRNTAPANAPTQAPMTVPMGISLLVAASVAVGSDDEEVVDLVRKADADVLNATDTSPESTSAVVAEES